MLTLRKDGEAVDDDNPADSLDMAAVDNTSAAGRGVIALVKASAFTGAGTGERSFAFDDATTDDMD